MYEHSRDSCLGYENVNYLSLLFVAKEKKKIGLVLGGGGAKAIIYLGFYEVLNENGIEIDYIAGTSMGAIIGAAIALGYKPQELQEYFRKQKNFNLTGLANFNFFNESRFPCSRRDDHGGLLP